MTLLHKACKLCGGADDLDTLDLPADLGTVIVENADRVDQRHGIAVLIGGFLCIADLPEHGAAGLPAADDERRLHRSLTPPERYQVNEGRPEDEPEQTDPNDDHTAMQHGVCQGEMPCQELGQQARDQYPCGHAEDAGEVILGMEVAPELVIGAECRQTQQAADDVDNHGDDQILLRQVERERHQQEIGDERGNDDDERIGQRQQDLPVFEFRK